MHKALLRRKGDCLFAAGVLRSRPAGRTEAARLRGGTAVGGPSRLRASRALHWQPAGWSRLETARRAPSPLPPPLRPGPRLQPAGCARCAFNACYAILPAAAALHEDKKSPAGLCRVSDNQALLPGAHSPAPDLPGPARISRCKCRCNTDAQV